VEIRADVPDCRMTAVGPAGALGLAVVPGRATSTIYRFELPEPGEWFLDAECSGQHVAVRPAAVQIRSASAPIPIDVQLAGADTLSGKSPRDP